MIASGLNALEALTKSIHTALSKKFRTRLSIITLPIKPEPASRPRMSRYGVYYSKAYTDWRNEARKHIAKVATAYTGALIVVVEVCVLKPKYSKKKWPKGDVDNYVKGPLDAITETNEILKEMLPDPKNPEKDKLQTVGKIPNVWVDDDQIVGLWVTKRFTLLEEEVGMVISIYGEQ
jgi:Holliday junction resolvase RusA-like endonuclease